ncbi:hypothetical protein BDZ45DRAFT_194104 [Acephala macrosclerotiorum]|nr:hypothetical protein BDZ45DRAFT_194104 [Acephala macrosclerotiorum]
MAGTSQVDHHLLSLEQRKRMAPSLRAVGQPMRKRRISIADIVTITFCLLLFAVGLACVKITSIAAYLGQKDQLIIIGFLLSLMGFCASKQIQLVLIALEVRTGHSTLQNLEAILSSNLFSQGTQLRYKVALSLLLATPLALSVGYKSFVGGSSSTKKFLISGRCGWTGPPGTQDLGFGLSLFVNVTLPWFEDPGYDRAYGFNMYTMSENTTAILDGPLPDYVSNLQSKLSNDQSMSITTEVNATVADLYNGLSRSRDNLSSTFETDINTPFSAAGQQWIGTPQYWVGLLGYSTYDISTMWMSWWDVNIPYNKTSNQTFGSQAREYKISRQAFNGTWTITQDSISLQNVEAPAQPVMGSQSVLKHNILAIPALYTQALPEYDYLFRKLRDTYANNTKYTNFVKTDSSLVAAMVWSRITALGGPETGNNDTDAAYVSWGTAQITGTTLRKHWALVLILAVNPVLVLISLAARAFVLYNTPIGEGFGLVSVLAGADTSTLAILRGAGLSGKLAKEVKVHIEVGGDDEVDAMHDSGAIKIVFGEGGRSGRLRNGYMYG